MPPDLPVLMFVDRQVPRFQRWTGIPKWRVAMNLRCAFGGLLGLSILSNPTSHPVWTFWGGVLMAAWVVIGNVWTATYRPTGKQEQETADKIATPIFNYLMYGSRSAVLRLSAVVITLPLILIGIKEADWLTLSAVPCVVLAAYLECTHTYPMEGPYLLDRVKGRLRRKPKLVPSPVPH